MARLTLVELAKQGNTQAIAALLNQAVKSLGVSVRVSLEAGQLRVMLESVQTPDSQITTRLVQAEIAQFGGGVIKTVKLYGRQTGQDVPAWDRELEVPLASPGLVLSTRKRPPMGLMVALRSFRFGAIVPYREALHLGLYRSSAIRLLLFFGLFPLVVDLVAGADSLQQTAWLLGIYYASIWGVVLFDLIKPAQFSWSNSLKCVLFTVAVGIPLLLFVQRVPIFRALYSATQGELLPRLLGFVLGVGLLEELCKALPVYLFLLRPGKLSDPLTSAFYGVTSGLGFAIAEGAAYSIRYALNLAQGDINLGAYVLANTIRFITLPLFHAILAGISGYFLGLAAINPSRQSALICIGIAIAAVLHGFYNTFANQRPLGLAIITFSVILFVAYLRRSRQMVSELQQAELDYQSNRQDGPG